MISLLHNDGKLLATKIDPFTVYNITDHLDGNIIKKIIYNNDRLIILTTTKLYNLYFAETNFQLDDITDTVNLSININLIKFVTNVNDCGDDFCIISCSDLIYRCTFETHNLKSVTSILNFIIGDIIATSDNMIGVIYKQFNSYVVGQCDNTKRHMNMSYSMNRLPLQFINPNIILTSNNSIISGDNGFKRTTFDVTHIFNEYYYAKDNIIWHMNGHVIDSKYNKHITDQYEVLDVFYSQYIYNIQHIILKTVNKQRIVECYTNTSNHQIATSHYHTKSLGQFNNNTYDILWSKLNHHLFDKYTDKFVKFVITCHKYGKLKQWIPKPILLVILSFIL